MIEQHLCAHPLTPGYAHPSPAGICEWVVKQMYNFCVMNDLHELWAYLWGNGIGVVAGSYGHTLCILKYLYLKQP